MITGDKLITIYGAFAVAVFIYCVIDSPKDEPTMLVRILACASVAIVWPVIALWVPISAVLDCIRGER